MQSNHAQQEHISSARNWKLIILSTRKYRIYPLNQSSILNVSLVIYQRKTGKMSSLGSDDLYNITYKCSSIQFNHSKNDSFLGGFNLCTRVWNNLHTYKSSFQHTCVQMNTIDLTCIHKFTFSANFQLSTTLLKMHTHDTYI